MIVKTKMIASGNKWRANWSYFPFFTTTSSSSSSKRIDVMKLHKLKACVTYCMSHSSNGNGNGKKANLSATRKERIKLPIYDYDDDNTYHIREFLNHPSGIQAILNTGALQSFQFLDSYTNTYRCTLPKIQLFNFEAAPVLDLRVTPTNQDCKVELLSCKFEGSKLVERQNDHFSAFMTNQMTWDANDSEPFLEVDVKLNLCLEIYTRPFTLLPISAVEGPGNLMMQALLDKLVPLLLQQLLQDYDKWVCQQRENSP